MFYLRGAHAAFLGTDFVVVANHAHTAFKGFGIEVENSGFNACVGKVHGDAAAHGAGANNGDFADCTSSGLWIDTGNFGGGTLCKEQVFLSASLRRVHALLKQFGFQGQTFTQR